MALYKKGVSREDVIDRTGYNRTAIQRWCRQNKISFKTTVKEDKALIKKVMKFYETHTAKETKEKYKGARYIIENIMKGAKKAHRSQDKKFNPLEIIKLIKMMGFFPVKEINKKIKLHYPSQKSLPKRCLRNLFGHVKVKRLYGLYHSQVQHFIKEGCPRYETITGSKVYLYCDIIKFLKQDTPKELKMAIETMAIFQEWTGLKNFIKRHKCAYQG